MNALATLGDVVLGLFLIALPVAVGLGFYALFLLPTTA